MVILPRMLSANFLRELRLSMNVCATSYALSHLPLDDEILHNAQFVDVQKRLQADFTRVSYFVVRFSKILPYSDTKSQEHLFEQFTQYQLMLDNAVPSYIWNDAKILEKDENDEQVVYYIEWMCCGHILAV